MRSAKPLALLFGGTFGAALFAMLAQLILARSLDVADFGRLAAILTAVNLFSPMASFGINWFWVQAFGREGYGGFRWVQPSLALLTITTGLSVIALAIYLTFAGSMPVALRVQVALLAAVMLLGQCAIDIASAKFQLEERFGMLTIWQALPQLGRLIVGAGLGMVAATSLLRVMFGYGAIGAFLTAYGFHACVQLSKKRVVLAGHKPPPRTDQAPSADVPGIAQTARLAFPFAFITVFYLVYFQSSILLINAIIGAEATAHFSAALLILAAAFLVPNILFTKFLVGRICRWAEHDLERYDAILHVSVVGMAATGVVASAVLALLAPVVVPLLFGARYTEAAWLLVWLTPTIPLRFVQSAYSAMLVSEANVRRRVRYAGISAALSLAFNLALLPTLGLAGAVLASIASEGVLLILNLIGVSRHVEGVHPRRSLRPAYLRAAIARLSENEAAVPLR